MRIIKYLNMLMIAVTFFVVIGSVAIPVCAQPISESTYLNQFDEADQSKEDSEVLKYFVLFGLAVIFVLSAGLYVRTQKNKALKKENTKLKRQNESQKE